MHTNKINDLLTVSLVIYKHSFNSIKPTLDSLLGYTGNIKIYIINNSTDESVKSQLESIPEIEYIKSKNNIGYGAANNLAIHKIINHSKYHLVINPDVYFEPNMLEQLIGFMEADEKIGLLTPKIFYPNGQIQYLCKLLPTPMDLFIRRFVRIKAFQKAHNHNYEMKYTGYDDIMYIPYVSGCFMLFNVRALNEIGLFDERIFMYIEDADISRRMYKRYKVLFFPNVQVHHKYQKGSYNNLLLTLYHIHGAFIYFNKWGWFFDHERKKINQQLKKEQNYLYEE